VRAYAYDLACFLDWLGAAKIALNDVNGSFLLEFIGAQRQVPTSPRTINRRLVTIRVFYRFCFDAEIPSARGALRSNPYYRGRGYDAFGIFWGQKAGSVQLRVKAPRKLIEPLSPEAVNTFCKTVRRRRDTAIVLLLLLCGLRSCEIIMLRVGDVDLTALHLRLRGKGDKERVMPLPQDLVPIIMKYLRQERPADAATDRLFVILQGRRRGQAMSAAGLRSIFRHRRRARGLEKANAHRFRHTFGADMARSGVQLPVLQKMMGHSDGRTTLQYIELSLGDVAADYQRAVEKLKNRYEQLT
jgi:site-specific recombinase XerD